MNDNVINISGNDMSMDTIVCTGIDNSIHSTLQPIGDDMIFDIVLKSFTEKYPHRNIEQIKNKIWIDKVERFNVGTDLLYNLLQLCNALKNEI